MASIGKSLYEHAKWAQKLSRRNLAGPAGFKLFHVTGQNYGYTADFANATIQ